MRLLKSAGKNLTVLVFWLLVWELLALRVGSALLLPTPVSVARRTLELVLTAQFWRITGLSLARLLLGVAAGVALGVLTAALTARQSARSAPPSPCPAPRPPPRREGCAEATGPLCARTAA